MAMKIGIIGCGAFCSGTHIPSIMRNPEFKIKALCDLDEKRLNELKNKTSAEYVTNDMEKFFKDPEIEMVICGTKPNFRLPIMELAVKYNKHLFVEKPLCMEEKQIEKMVPLMKSSKGLFMVGFNRPYSPMMRDVKTYFHKYKKDNSTIIYRIVGEAQLWPKTHYNAVMVKKESTIIHEVTHIFDLLNWLTELSPVRVYTAGGGNVDNIITLNYPENITAVIIAGDNSSAGFPKERIEINTNHGTLIGDDFVELWMAGWDDKSFRKTYESRVDGKPANISALEFSKKAWEWRVSVTKEERDYGYYYNRSPGVNKGHYNELEEFRKMIVEKRPSVTDVIKGAMANLIAWRAMESWEKGKPVDLDFKYLDNF